MPTRTTIHFTCRTPTCESYCRVDADGPLPKDWECPACQMHTEQQMLDDLERRERNRNRPNQTRLN